VLLLIFAIVPDLIRVVFPPMPSTFLLAVFDSFRS
jgi:hypothetical protein